MCILPDFLRSLLLTTLLSFAAPILLVGTMLTTLFFMSCIPGFVFLGEAGATGILEFLTIFGSGCPVQGILTIGFACSIVGTLFDLFNFYRYQSWRG
jgi:hypothetical protein